MIVIENKFELGQIVYLKTDAEQIQRMVTQVTITVAGLRYCLSAGTNDTWHYEVEISEEKNVLISTS